jgi:hypothetical protein
VDVEDSNDSIFNAFGNLPTRLEKAKEYIEAGISMMCSVDDFLNNISDFYSAIVDSTGGLMSKKKIFLEGKFQRRSKSTSKDINEIKTWFSHKEDAISKWSDDKVNNIKSKIDHLKRSINSKSSTCNNGNSLGVAPSSTGGCVSSNSVVDALKRFGSHFHNLLTSFKSFMEKPIVKQSICYINCVYGLLNQALSIGNVVQGLLQIAVNFVLNFTGVLLIIKFIWKILCNLETFSEIAREAKSAINATDKKQRYFHLGKTFGLILQVGITFLFKKK